MRLRELPAPTAENCQEIWEKCVAVKAGDGTMFTINGVPALGKWDDSQEDHPTGSHGYTLWDGNVGSRGIDVNHDLAHLLGWTFYERLEPLVWEGECVMYRNPRGTRLESADDFPGGKFLGKRFHVVATEIMEEGDGA